MSHLLFLSHAGIDSEAALQLARRIEASEDAQRAGLRVFIDKADLRAGGRWKDQLQQALRDSTAFAVYVGSKGVVNWVWDEVSVALDRIHVDPAYPVIPVIGANADIAALPSFLSQFQGVSRLEEEPEQFHQFVRALLRLERRAAVASESEPFVGLEAFDGRKAHLFFGRGPEVDELVEIFRDETLAMVVGDSGSGKSSLVKAGLVPAFRGGRLARARDAGPDDTLWHVIETRPGNDPFGRFADDLRKAAEAAGKGPRAASEIAELVRERNPVRVRDALLSSLPADRDLRTKVLLVVDQFEEFRTSPDAAAYTGALLALAREGDDTVRIILTMRRDYYYLCSGFPDLWGRLERNDRRARFHLRRIPKDRLRACVIEPLRLAGTEAQGAALADAVIKDAGDEPGELALVQMALWRTWRRRAECGNDLLRAYQAIGRVDGAIAQTAEEAFDCLSETEKSRAEGLFVRLVRPGETGGATRRPARLGEFDEETQALARKLAGAEWRLLTVGEDTLEIAHEALATQWHQYQRWISNAPGDARGDDLRTLQALVADAAGWEQADKRRKREHLARGHDIAQYGGLAARRSNWPTGTEQNYIVASQNSAKGTRRLKWGAITAVVLLMLTAVSALYFIWAQNERIGRMLTESLAAFIELERQTRLIDEARKLAEAQRRLAVGRALTASTLQLFHDPKGNRDLIGPLALEALARLPPAERAELATATSLSVSQTIGGGQSLDFAFLPAGRELAVIDESGLRLIDMAAGTERRIPLVNIASDPGRSFQFNSAPERMSNDGRFLVLFVPGKEILIDVKEAETRHVFLNSPHDRPWHLPSSAFSRDSRYFATIQRGATETHLAVLDLSDPGKEPQMHWFPAGIASADFVGDQPVIAILDPTLGKLVLLDLRDGARHDALTWAPERLGLYDLGSSGAHLVVAIDENQKPGETARQPESVGAEIHSPGVYFLDVAAPERPSSIAPQPGMIAHAPDGKQLAVRSGRGGLTVWSMPERSLVWSKPEESPLEGRFVRSVQFTLLRPVFSKDGQWLADGSGGQGVLIWNTKQFGRGPARVTFDFAWEVTFLPGRGLALVHGSGRLDLVRIEDGSFLAQSRGGGSTSDDGKLLATRSGWTMQVSRLDPQEFSDWLCAQPGKNLTRVEWRRYLGDEPWRPTCPGWTNPN